MGRPKGKIGRHHKGHERKRQAMKKNPKTTEKVNLAVILVKCATLWDEHNLVMFTYKIAC